MKPKRADMDTLARITGVSKTTVHRALQNSGRISPATRQRILDVAQELGYRPNRLARSLRAQRTGTFAVVVIGITGSFYAHILEGMEQVAQQQDYSLLLACSHGDPEKERSLIEVLLEKQVDGLIVAPSDPQENADYYRSLIAQEVPLVFIDRDLPDLPIDCVSTDNIRGGYLAARHLLQCGCKQLFFFPTASRERKASSVLGRLRGCNQALTEAGLPPAMVLDEQTPDILPQEEFAYEGMERFLRAGGRTDGVFAVNDDIAFGVIRALEAHGLRVPEDVSVVGFDDQDSSAFFRPPLTTIRQPMRQIGEEAARLLLLRIANAETAPPRQQVLLEPLLVIRRSSEPN